MQTAQLDVADSAISGSCFLPVTALTSFVHPSHSAHMLACCVPVTARHHFCLHPSRHESLIRICFCCVADNLEALQRDMSWVHPLQHVDRTPMCCFSFKGYCPSHAPGSQKCRQRCCYFVNARSGAGPYVVVLLAW